MKRLIALLVLLMFVGCDFNEESPSTSISESEIRKGTDALVINFEKGMPPKEIYETDVFPVGVELKNRGAYNIENGYVLINLELDTMELEDSGDGSDRERINIEGKSLVNQEGGFDVVSFSVKSRALGSEMQSVEPMVLITACYGYQTILSETVCVDTDFYNTKRTVKACSAKDVDVKGGQGGVVSVTKIEPVMMEDDGILKPSYIIHMKNEGKGEVVNGERVSDLCSSSTIKTADINHIDVRAYLGEQELVCGPIPIKLRDKEDTVRCTLEDGLDKDAPSYSTLLNIEMDYGYTETISKKITVKRII